MRVSRAVYRAALEKDANNMSLVLRLGAAQVLANQLDEAEQTLAKVIREIPNSAEAEYFIGRISFARGRTADALALVQRAIAHAGDGGYTRLRAMGLLMQARITDDAALRATSIERACTIATRLGDDELLARAGKLRGDA